MKTRLIINPVSGSDSGPEYLKTINERIREKFDDLDIVMTTGAGDARQSGERSVREGYAQIFVAGGDGTLNEVLNGVASTAGGLERTTFGLIPLGTGNDFADALGLPEDVEAALDILLNGRVISVDVGKLNDYFFVNVSAGGFIAEVSDAVNPELKSIAGKLAYLVGGAQVLFDYEPVETHVRVKGEQGMTEQNVSMQMFAVCNSRMVGGGRMIAPHAVIDDEMLDVCFVEAMPTLEFLNLLRLISTGDHVDDERVQYFRTQELELRFEREIKVNTDGEVLTTNICRYKVLPHAARFLAGEAPFAEQ